MSDPYLSNELVSVDNDFVDENPLDVQGDNEDHDSEDEYYENPVDLIKEFGTHPLMEKAQKALTKQLKETQYRLKVQVLEKEDSLKRVGAERENLGVQLYSLQQQLARIQLTLETTQNDYNASIDARLQEEDLLKNIVKNNLVF